MNDLQKVIDLANSYWENVVSQLPKNSQVQNESQEIIAKKMLDIALLYIRVVDKNLSQLKYIDGSFGWDFTIMDAIKMKPEYQLGEFNIKVNFKIDNVTRNGNESQFENVIKSKYSDNADYWLENNFNSSFPVLMTMEIDRCPKSTDVLIGQNIIRETIWNKNLASIDLNVPNKMESQYGFIYQSSIDKQRHNPTTATAKCMVQSGSTGNEVMPVEYPETIKTSDDCPCEEVVKTKTLYLRPTQGTPTDIAIAMPYKKIRCTPIQQSKTYRFKCDENDVRRKMTDLTTTSSKDEQSFFPSNIGKIR